MAGKSFLRGITPSASWWYAKAALDHMIVHQLQEMASLTTCAPSRTRSTERGPSFARVRYPHRYPDSTACPTR